MGSSTSKEHVQVELRKLKGAWMRENNDLSQLIEQTLWNLNSLMNVRLKIAIIGVSGAGKSSLVNALRGIDDDDEGAAETGVIETTKDPKEYPHPTFPNVTIWDLPGFDGVKFKANKYSQLEEIMKYDFFIIVTSGRFTEHDLLLVQEIHKIKKKFYFVRTKLDTDIEPESKKKNFCEKDTLEKIKEYCCANLREEIEYHPRVFLISNHHQNRFDFRVLLQDIESELDEIKKHTLLTALSNKSKEILKRKNDAMKALVQEVVLVAAASEATSFSDLHVVCDIPFLEEIMIEFSKAFGLDEGSLHRLAKQVGKSVHVLSSAITKTKIASQINSEFVRSLLSNMRKCRRISFESKILYYVPMSHRLFFDNDEFLTLTLHHFLDNAEEDAVNVFAKAFEN